MLISKGFKVLVNYEGVTGLINDQRVIEVKTKNGDPFFWAEELPSDFIKAAEFIKCYNAVFETFKLNRQRSIAV